MKENNNQESKSSNEEVDLVVFFNLIGKALNNVFTFITFILKSVFSVLIYTIKTFVNSWKIILGVILICFAIGYALERTKPVLYQSEMLVKPYFDSKFQLVNNISFFNALIANKNYEELSKIFNSENTPNVVVEDIKGFKIEPGPETENDRVLQYQSFVRELDSFGRQQVDYDRFIENRSIYSGSIFLITAKSNKKDIFKNLSYGINSAFTNEYSTSKKRKDTLLYKIQRNNIENSLKQVGELQEIYISALQDQAKNPIQPVQFGELLMTKDNKTDTKEYALLDKELALRDQLRRLDEKKITEDVFVDVITSFQPVGHQKVELLNRYSIVFPFLGFILLCLFYVVKRVVIYAKNYED
ncbi:hypothetical protein [uncultured Lacinutrix sp.]|uniref:hypothetical protein n=1 Tax=uncultured Lacinutrix sp. TaxID=574032 RepID=UPI00261975FD|nr:hypothetical protein [uncultured Lacinutrix sp.]